MIPSLHTGRDGGDFGSALEPPFVISLERHGAD